MRFRSHSLWRGLRDEGRAWRSADWWIFVDVVNSLSMKSAGATDDAVYFITPGEQKFREVRAVLARDTGNDGALHWSSVESWFNYDFAEELGLRTSVDFRCASPAQAEPGPGEAGAQN